jgi:hypothetical protein
MIVHLLDVQRLLSLKNCKCLYARAITLLLSQQHLLEDG